MIRPAGNDERLARVESVYFQVLKLPEAEQAAAIDRLCRNDPALIAEVASLIDHSSQIEGFLEAPALGRGFAMLPATANRFAQGDCEPDEFVGQKVGRYRIERRIASGGMGTVYLGTRADEQFAQRVAVKIVKRGMDTDEIVRRFRRERQTLAALEHQNIARLIDGGATQQGQPYLVMEYVDGEPIDAWCDRRELGVEARLGLFLVVCDAVRYAHQHLVVHRDLKPSNILVSSDGTPKLLDFGIAMVLDEPRTTAVTAPGERWLTPEYASPEHVAGSPVSTTSDVYSLGAILCKLLTGCTPYRFESRTAEEVQRVVAANEPRAPSDLVRNEPPTSTVLAIARALGTKPDRLARRLRGDLDTIVLAALRRDPARRYSSAEGLAADVRRHLDRVPVTARRDSLAYRVGRFAQRHAWASAFAGTSIALLIAFVATFAWQARVAAGERDRALAARAQSEAVAGFLSRMLESADPALSGPNATVQDMLRNAAGRLDGELGGQPIIQASLHATIGRTYAALGSYDEAEKELRLALLRRLELQGPDHVDSAAVMCDLASVLYARGTHEEAADLLRDAVRTLRRSPDPETPELAAALSSLGVVMKAQRRFHEAESLQREALDIRRRLPGGDRLGEAESLNNLAGVLRARGDFAGARPMLEEALNIRRERLGPDHPLVAQSLDNLAVLLHGEGALELAEPLYRRALDLELRVFGPLHPEVAVTRNNLALLLVAEGCLAEAEEQYRSCHAIRVSTLPETDPRRVTTALDLADVLLARGRAHDAEPLVAGVLDATRNLDPTSSARAIAVARATSFFEKVVRQERHQGSRTHLPAR